MFKLFLVTFFTYAIASNQSPKGFLLGATLKGKGEVQILSFKPHSQLVKLISVDLPGEGSFWVYSKDLIKAAQLDSPKNTRLVLQIKSGKSSLICKKITLKKGPIQTFMEDQKPEPDLPDNQAPQLINPCKSK